MRVHWAAGCVPNEATDMCLVQYGTVVTSANEQSTVAGFEGVATGIRSVFMSGNRGQIPHILQVADPVTAEVYKLLCVITGRKPQYIAAFNHSPIVENISDHGMVKLSLSHTSRQKFTNVSHGTPLHRALWRHRFSAFRLRSLFFACRMTEPWSRMRKLSLILSGPKDGCTYKREDFLPALEKIVEGKLGASIVSFGPLARNTEWHLAVKDQNIKDRFMAAACLNVKGYSFRVRSADRTQFVVRVHWAAGRVPHEAIDTSLGLYGTVITSANEQSTVAGFEGVATGIRSVVMSGNRDQIPHLLQVADPVTAEVYQLLCVITGRKPLCLKCKGVGHYRRDCTTPYCRHHDAYGHDSEGCSAAKSYAAATRRDLRKQEDSSEYDTEEEDIGLPCARVSLTKPSTKMPRFAYKKARYGLLELVMVKGAPPLPLSRRRRWSRCPNPVRTVPTAGIMTRTAMIRKGVVQPRATRQPPGVTCVNRRIVPNTTRRRKI